VWCQTISRCGSRHNSAALAHDFFSDATIDRTKNHSKQTMKIQNLKPTFGIAPGAEAATGRAPSKTRKTPRHDTPATQPMKWNGLTEVAARIDVGMGNTVYIRGEGDGLSWDKGTPLKCKDASTWVWSTAKAKEKLVFKLLLNDVIWARGADIVVEPGKRVEVAPVF
jgi:hypothetical protein